MENNTTAPNNTQTDAATNPTEAMSALPPPQRQPQPAAGLAQPASMPAHPLEAIERHELWRRGDNITRNMHALRALPYAPAAVARGDVDYRPGRRRIDAFGPFYQYLEAYMVQARFAPRADADRCVQCRAGLGPFTTCVAAPGVLGGSCACCHWSRQTKKCSLRGNPHPQG